MWFAPTSHASHSSRNLNYHAKLAVRWAPELRLLLVAHLHHNSLLAGDLAPLLHHLFERPPLQRNIRILAVRFGAESQRAPIIIVNGAKSVENGRYGHLN